VSGQWSETAGPSGLLRFYAAGGPREGTAPLLLLCPELPIIEGARGDVALLRLWLRGAICLNSISKPTLCF
jgi:hypothetical protein